MTSWKGRFRFTWVEPRVNDTSVQASELYGFNDGFNVGLSPFFYGIKKGWIHYDCLRVLVVQPRRVVLYLECLLQNLAASDQVGADQVVVEASVSILLVQ